MTARLYELARDLAPVLEDIDDCAKSLSKTCFQAGVTQHEAQRLRQTAVDELEVLLKGEIVGKIQFADAGRVAAAAEILHEESVVELCELVLIEADFLADFDADTAASRAMTRRLTFG